MNRSNYYGVFTRYPRSRLSGLGIIPDQRSQTYSNPDTSIIDTPALPPRALEVLDYVRKAGFTDILITPTGPVLTGPAEVIYRYSPRAVIEGELNPFMNYLSREQVISFWRNVYAILNPALKIKSLNSLMSQFIRVIPDPGAPDTEFFSLSKMRLFGPGPIPPALDYCSSVAREQYSSVDGPVAIVSPAGERLFVAHSVQSSDLNAITQCRGLAWPSFAINQGIHDFPAFVTFYLDARIMQRNLGFKGRVANRQKAVHFAAWDNWTIRISSYDEFIKEFNTGLTNGKSGSGFFAAEYLSVGLDTTSFEGVGLEDKFSDLSNKGSVHPLHTWDQVDDSALNIGRARRKEPIVTRYEGANYERFETSGYMEMKVTDFIPLSDIPMCIIHDTNDPVDMSVKRAETLLRRSGFRGIILVASYDSEDKKYAEVNRIVDEYVVRSKSIIYMPQDKTSGTFIPKVESPRPPNFIELKGGLIFSDTEITQVMYKMIMGTNPSKFKFSINNPVENVSWYDAVDFCNRFTEYMNKTYGYSLTPAYTIGPGKSVSWDKKADGFRLPTEDEWSMAAQINDRFLDEQTLKYEAWYNNRDLEFTNAVAKKDPNDLGLYDMIGNVAEWVWSPGKSAVVMGASYKTRLFDITSEMRDVLQKDTKLNNVGFRICRTVQKTKKEK